MKLKHNPRGSLLTFAIQMKKFITASILAALSVLIVVTFIFVRLRESLITYSLVTFDASPLYEALSGCDRVNLIKVSTQDGNEIIYETRDREEVSRVIDSIIVNTNSVRAMTFRIPSYYIIFYRDVEQAVRLEINARSRLRWPQSQATWDWKCDFWLTNESYRDLGLWFNGATGKSEDDLFMPHPDDASWRDYHHEIMRYSKYGDLKVIKQNN